MNYTHKVRPNDLPKEANVFGIFLLQSWQHEGKSLWPNNPRDVTFHVHPSDCRINRLYHHFHELASLISTKWDQPYINTIGWNRCQISFSLLHAANKCIGGALSLRNRTAWVPNDPIYFVTKEFSVTQEYYKHLNINYLILIIYTYVCISKLTFFHMLISLPSRKINIWFTTLKTNPGSRAKGTHR